MTTKRSSSRLVCAGLLCALPFLLLACNAGGGGPDPRGAGDEPGQEVSSGAFEPRAGHDAEGTARLVRLSDGSLELRFLDDFAISTVPGPVAYLSSRPALGSSIDPSTDVELGDLGSPPFSGAYHFAVPAGADVDRPYAWVWCDPVQVEVAVTRLEP